MVTTSELVQLMSLPIMRELKSAGPIRVAIRCVHHSPLRRSILLSLSSDFRTFCSFLKTHLSTPTLASTLYTDCKRVRRARFQMPFCALIAFELLFVNFRWLEQLYSSSLTVCFKSKRAII